MFRKKIEEKFNEYKTKSDEKLYDHSISSVETHLLSLYVICAMGIAFFAGGFIESERHLGFISPLGFIFSVIGFCVLLCLIIIVDKSNKNPYKK